MGQGKLKEPDPVKAPLVRRAFQLYATGSWTLEPLCEELYRSGLRNRRGGAVSINGLSTVLNNPFYIGIVRLLSTGETFQGIHEPLIGKSLFDRVQLVLQGKVSTHPGARFSVPAHPELRPLRLRSDRRAPEGSRRPSMPHQRVPDDGRPRGRHRTIFTHRLKEAEMFSVTPRLWKTEEWTGTAKHG